jgi:HK97 gp10 family phage protein
MTVEWHGDAILAQVRAAAMRGVVRGTEGVLEEGTSLILDGPKTGRIYRRGGVSHQASAPGEAPASDSGRLVQSGRTEFDQNDLSGTAQWSTAYAEALEHGNENMEPRPFARPALANRKDEIADDIASAIKAVLK